MYLRLLNTRDEAAGKEQSPSPPTRHHPCRAEHTAIFNKWTIFVLFPVSKDQAVEALPAVVRLGRARGMLRPGD